MAKTKETEPISIRVYYKEWKKMFDLINENKKKRSGPRSFAQLIEELLKHI